MPLIEVEIHGMKIEFSEDVLRIFDKYCQKGPRLPESGGILLGKLYQNRMEVVRATIPSKWDKSSRTRFVRNKDTAQLIVDYEFLNSGGQIIYLGEWHTHPEKNASPSGIDVKMIRDQYKLNRLNSDKIVLVIIGQKTSFLGLFDGKQLYSTSFTISV